MVFFDLIDDQAVDLPGKGGVQSGLLCQGFDTVSLGGLAVGIEREEPFGGLERTDLAGLAETFGQGVDEDRVELVDAVAQVCKVADSRSSAAWMFRERSVRVP